MNLVLSTGNASFTPGGRELSQASCLGFHRVGGRRRVGAGRKLDGDTRGGLAVHAADARNSFCARVRRVPHRPAAQRAACGAALQDDVAELRPASAAAIALSPLRLVAALAQRAARRSRPRRPARSAPVQRCAHRPASGRRSAACRDRARCASRSARRTPGHCPRPARGDSGSCSLLARRSEMSTLV